MEDGKRIARQDRRRRERIASIEDMFDLQRVAAMKAAEQKYLR